ncbi:MAG: molybdopterin-dependent oxidoreductase, partial [Raoultibacter sp.]
NYDAGVFKGTAHADDYMNAGNRGCNSCHADLYSAVADVEVNYKHLMAAGATYGKETGIADCLPCHYYNRWAGGPSLSDPVHAAHYSSSEFVDDKKGNCWSCHATDLSGKMVLWDLYKYTDEFGGFSNGGSEKMQDWISNMRGYEANTMAGITLDREISFENVAIDQHVTDLKDLFAAVNSKVPEYDESYKLQVTEGVNNPRSFTVDDLKNMSVTKTFTEACATNAINGFQVANLECTGVPIADIIEACGGLKDGYVGMKAVGDDQWSKSFFVQDLLDAGAMMCIAFNGEPLPPDQGYPVRLAIPGAPATAWVKYLSELTFATEPAKHFDWFTMASPTELKTYQETGFNLVHSSWINPSNDKVTFKLGEPISLEGYAYACNNSGHKTSLIAFSADYGNTWTTIDVPADADPYQWSYFTVEWNP